MNARLPSLVILSACITVDAYAPAFDPAKADAVVDTEIVGDSDPVETDASVETEPPDTDPATDTEVPVDTEVVEDTPVPIIDEVADGQTRPWKYVTLHNPGSRALPLTGYRLEKYSNGSTRASGMVELDAWTLQPQGLLVIGYGTERVAFEVSFGLSADVWSQAIDGNGDDTYALFDDQGLVDIYGEIGVDGTATPWEYSDAAVHRVTTVTRPAAEWEATEWVSVHASLATPFTR